MRYFLYVLYLCPFLDLGLFISYLSDLLFVFIFKSVNRNTNVDGTVSRRKFKLSLVITYSTQMNALSVVTFTENLLENRLKKVLFQVKTAITGLCFCLP